MFQTYLFVLHIDKRASNYCSLILLSYRHNKYMDEAKPDSFGV